MVFGCNTKYNLNKIYDLKNNKNWYNFQLSQKFINDLIEKMTEIGGQCMEETHPNDGKFYIKVI